jgi:cytochrome d ubiquinol oxidase subunit II
MMNMIEMNLPLIWLFLIGFFLLYYAVMDGADLGIGIISLFSRNEEERLLLMESIGTLWHSNQTWLVILGGMLFGAFPVFYALLLSSLYIPMVAMLGGLIFRGVAFEFRTHARHQKLWSLSFGFGSLLTTAAQGFALGGLLSGLEVENGRFAGSLWGWLNPLSLLVTLGVLFGYLMLGANFLSWKTEGPIQQRCFRWSKAASVVTLFISVGVYVWTTARYPFMARKWARVPDLFTTGFFPLLAGAAFIMYFRSLWSHRGFGTLLYNFAIVLFSFTGLSVGLYPYMIPNVIASPVSVIEAAASPQTLWTMLVVMLFLLPVILGYTLYSYLVFRGKVQDGYNTLDAHGSGPGGTLPTRGRSKQQQ